MRMGQFFDFVTDIAKNGFVYNKDNPDNSESFDAYIIRRNDAQDIFDAAYRIACPKVERKTDNMLIAEDMWTAIRHHLWMELPEEERRDNYSTASYSPLHYGSEPRIKIERDK